MNSEYFEMKMTQNPLTIPDSIKQLNLYTILNNTPQLIKKNQEIMDYCEKEKKKNLEIMDYYKEEDTCTYYDNIKAIKHVFDSKEYDDLKTEIIKSSALGDGEKNTLLIDLSSQSSGKKSRKRKHNKLKKKRKSTRKKRRKSNKKHR